LSFANIPIQIKLLNFIVSPSHRLELSGEYWMIVVVDLLGE